MCSKCIKSVFLVGQFGFTCEPDEYVKLVTDLKESGIIKDHRQGLTVHKNSFMGKDFVEWLVKAKGIGKCMHNISRITYLFNNFNNYLKTQMQLFILKNIEKHLVCYRA